MKIGKVGGAAVKKESVYRLLKFVMGMMTARQGKMNHWTPVNHGFAEMGSGVRRVLFV